MFVKISLSKLYGQTLMTHIVAVILSNRPLSVTMLLLTYHPFFYSFLPSIFLLAYISSLLNLILYIFVFHSFLYIIHLYSLFLVYLASFPLFIMHYASFNYLPHKYLSLHLSFFYIFFYSFLLFSYISSWNTYIHIYMCIFKNISFYV